MNHIAQSLDGAGALLNHGRKGNGCGATRGVSVVVVVVVAGTTVVVVVEISSQKGRCQETIVHNLIVIIITIRSAVAVAVAGTRVVASAAATAGSAFQFAFLHDAGRPILLLLLLSVKVDTVELVYTHGTVVNCWNHGGHCCHLLRRCAPVQSISWQQ